MRRLVLILLLAAPLSADTLAEIRAALAGLPARQPIRAAFDVQQSVLSEGRFDNDKYSGKASVEIQGGPDGFHFILPPSLLDQIAAEEQARVRDKNHSQPTISAINAVSATRAAQSLNMAPVLTRLLDGARLVTDATGTWQGKPARVVIARVADRLADDDAGKVKIQENRLTLWLGPDLVPLAAEHLVKAKFSVLIFKGETNERKSWHLARVADRLVHTRYEEQQNGSGMGQKGSETLIATLRVH